MKKVGKIIGNVLVTLVLIFSILMTVLVISSTKNESRLPNLFGKAIFNVETDSMLSEQGFDKGALIIVDLVDKEDCEDLKVGDVITYKRYYENIMYLDTHRIVEDTYSPQNEVVDGIWVHGGTRYYVTQGDNTPSIDTLSDGSIDYASHNNIVAKWTGIAIPHLGTVMSFLQSQLGFMLCVVIPTAIFFFFELFKFISTLMDAKKEKAVAAVKDAEEEIKQRLMAEIQAQQAESNSAPAKAPEEKPQAPAEPEKKEETEDEIKKKAVEEYIKQQEAEKAAAAKAAEEEEIKKKAVEEYIKQQEAEKAAAEKAAKEEELKKQAIAEYLAQQEAEKAAEESEK